MKKRILALIALCLAVSTLFGCVEDPPMPTQTAPTTQPTEPSSQPTEPQPTEPPAFTEPDRPEDPTTLAPVTQLECTQWLTYPQLLSLGGGKVVSSMNGYDSSVGHFYNSMQILDVYGDRIAAELRTEHTLELVDQRFRDGHILTIDPASRTAYDYDASLALQTSFTVPTADGRFSYDRQSYYYIQDGLLYRMNVSSGNRARMLLDQDLRLARFVGIHPTEDLLVAKFYLSPYTDDCGLAVIDVRTGICRMVTDDYHHITFTGDHFFALRMSNDGFGYDIYTGTLTGDSLRRITLADLGGDVMRYSVLPGSHLLVAVEPADEPPRRTEIYDLSKGGAVVKMASYGLADPILGPVYLYDEDLILAFCEDGAYFRPLVIDPKALTYSDGLTLHETERAPLVDPDLIANYHERPALSADLAPFQTLIDRLEEKYAVTVKIGDQTAPILAHAGFQAAAVTDPAQLQAALMNLDVELSYYPEDFFKKFRNGAGEGGICIALTGKITADLPTVGFAKLLRQTYALGVDITAPDFVQTVHHEIWHAIEMVISTDTFTVLDWDQCNPSGFKYYGKYDLGYRDLTRWTYPDSGAESWFVDPYSRINGREDRARIWEEAMKDSSDALDTSPYLRTKLELMHTALTAAFGDLQWP